MTEEIAPDTRARILRAALGEFAARGYYATSIREIAERVGVTKTAVLYHFPGKADILAALAEPMLTDLDVAVTALGSADPAVAPPDAVEVLLEVWLTHRYLIRMNLHDLAMATAGPLFERFRDGMVRANRLIAGPDPDFARQVRAAQAIAMLSDPVVLFADAPVDELRACVLDGVRRLLGVSPRTGPAPRPTRGRPATMSPAMAETARHRHAEGRTATEIAAELGVSRATVYRHLPRT